MRIAVIGAGHVGSTLGRRWATLGNAVVFGVRRPEEGMAALAGEGEWPPSTAVASLPEAVKDAEVVVLATPWAAVDDVLRACGATSGALDGVTLIDATNPIASGFRIDAGPDGASGAERVQAMAKGARVVKAFNTTGFENMEDPRYADGAATMFIAGDDADAKSAARGLASALGFEPVDAGPLVRARASRNAWIALAAGIGVPPMGRDIAFQLMRR